MSGGDFEQFFLKTLGIGYVREQSCYISYEHHAKERVILQSCNSGHFGGPPFLVYIAAECVFLQIHQLSCLSCRTESVIFSFQKCRNFPCYLGSECKESVSFTIVIGQSQHSVVSLNRMRQFSRCCIRTGLKSQSHVLRTVAVIYPYTEGLRPQSVASVPVMLFCRYFPAIGADSDFRPSRFVDPCPAEFLNRLVSVTRKDFHKFVPSGIAVGIGCKIFP